MTTRIIATLLSLFLLLHGVSSQIGPDSHWVRPDGSKPDFSNAFTAGTNITISWQALNNSRSDLYLSHFDGQTYPWHYQVAKNLDISVAGTFRWYIDVPTFTIQNDSKFVLHFFPVNAAYGLLNFNIKSSPGFLLAAGVASSSATSATVTDGTTQSGPASTTSGSGSTSSIPTTVFVTTTNAAGSAVVATITTAVPNPVGVNGASQTTDSTSSGGGLSTGAEAGIGVGVGLLVVILFVGACFFGRRYRLTKTLRGHEHGLEKEGFPMTPGHGHKQGSAIGMGGESTPYGETLYKAQTSNTGEAASLVRPPWTETSGNYNFPVEKDGAMVRPGLHEIG